MISWWWILVSWVPFWFFGFLSHYFAQRWRVDELNNYNSQLQKEIRILRGRVIRQKENHTT